MRSRDRHKVWLGQPTILTSWEKNFGEEVAKQRPTLTPGTPGHEGTKAEDEASVVPPEKRPNIKVKWGLYCASQSTQGLTSPVSCESYPKQWISQLTVNTRRC